MERGVVLDDEMNEISAAELIGWIELGCWISLALLPLLYWVNGAAVSSDQLVVRWIVVMVVICGSVGLRARRWLGVRRQRQGGRRPVSE